MEDYKRAGCVEIPIHVECDANKDHILYKPMDTKYVDYEFLNKINDCEYFDDNDS